MKSYNIIEKYFSDEDENADDGMNAQTTANGTFGFGAQAGGAQGGFNFANGADSMDM
jgi:hypothetical protein